MAVIVAETLEQAATAARLVEAEYETAEPLLDAICQATDMPEALPGMPRGTRAVQLPDGQVIDTGGQYASWDRHPFLKAFGQPAREAVRGIEVRQHLDIESRPSHRRGAPFGRLSNSAHAHPRLSKKTLGTRILFR